ncbi:MAG: hypothetical protein HY287_06215 [Planctomycetes bacterium]|nr:hypothetical protein [Planctomycetota bacterium]
MKAKSMGGWRPVVGVLAIGCFTVAVSLRLEGAPMPKQTRTATDQAKPSTLRDGTARVEDRLVNPDLPTRSQVLFNNMGTMAGDYPAATPIIVNYLDDEGTRGRQMGLFTGPMPKIVGSGEQAVANIPGARHCVGGGNAGGVCSNDAACPGVADGTCTAGHCVGGLSPGVACVLAEDCLGSHCGCSFAIDCEDGNPCTNDRCSLANGQPAGSGKCVYTFVQSGVDQPYAVDCRIGSLCGGCDDGIACNGKETCNGAGACVSSGALACGGGSVCNENGRCSDGKYCTIDADCASGTCNHCQTTCTTNANCDDGLLCNGAETCVAGKCTLGTPPCGPGGTCYEKKCSAVANNPWGCSVTSDCRTGTTCTVAGPACLPGRCCDNATQPNCSRRALNITVQGNGSCNSTGGKWFAGDKGTTSSLAGPSSFDLTCPASNDATLPGGVPGLHCPKYGDGIAPQNSGPLIGPISDSRLNVAPFGSALNKLGDDYQMTDSSNILVDELHFIGGAFVQERISFEMYDFSGNFIEDTFIIMNTNLLAMQTILFQPAIEIPPHGYIVMTVASSFAPNTRIFWASTDSGAVDTGSNDANLLWINGGPAANPLSAPNKNLTLELVGRKTTASSGACCLTNPGPTQACDNGVAPWVCEGLGGIYLGNAQQCAACSGGVNTGNNCRRCSVTTGQSCDRNSDCPGGETCVANNVACPGGTCVSSASCNNGACCVNKCVGGGNDGLACATNANCPGGACRGVCSESTPGSCTGTFQGFGTTCDVDNGYGGTGDQQSCCPQPVATGGDNCSDAVVQAIHLPAPGSDPVVVTITGSNLAASSTVQNPDSCITLFQPSPDPEQDVGWWEAFSIDACAYVRVDTCCTGSGSNILRPAWGLLFPDCPCGALINDTPNPNSPLFNNGPEPSFNRGGPYCPNDNIWFWFGPLTAGTYYYPVYSALLGYHGTYQLHITAQPCPTAACCSNKCIGGANNGNTCSDNAGCPGGLCQGSCAALNILDCATAGGYYLGPPNKSPATSTCTGTPGSGTATCDNGSCCTAPGVCVDRDLTPPVSAQECLTSLNGNFIGGIRCKGGVCNTDNSISCNADGDCPTGDTCNATGVQKAQANPCPICEIQGATNCQGWEDTGNFGLLSSAVAGSGGLVNADDFKSNSSTVSTICVWGEYINSAPHAVPFDCGNNVTADSFRVRIYDDFEGLPCSVVAESTASAVRANVHGKTELIQGFQTSTWGHQLTLNTPVTGLDASGNTIYWLEVSNAPASSISTCVWFWDQLGAGTTTGNHYSASGSNAGYPSGSENTTDYSWCLNGNVVAGASGDIIRNCCNCGAGTCSLLTLKDCRAANGIWDVDNQTVSCGTCVTGGPSNDLCTSTIGNYVSAGTYFFDTQCANTDGPVASDHTEIGSGAMSGDVWYRFQPTVNCTLTASMCATGTAFDSMVGIYHKTGDPNYCPTTDNTQLANGHYEDESCTGVAVAGAGLAITPAIAGDTYLIRVGGFNGAHGSGQVNISCAVASNSIALDPPTMADNAARGTRNCPAGGPGNPGQVVADSGPDKNRYVAFAIPVTATAAGETAIQIKRVKLQRPSPPNLPQFPPPNFSAFENQFSYAGSPTKHCQNGGVPPCAVPSDAIFDISVTQCAANYINWQTALAGGTLFVKRGTADPAEHQRRERVRGYIQVGRVVAADAKVRSDGWSGRFAELHHSD